ncbi:MAG: hypothetical protein ACW99U_05415 [Candidatus Thorarchaeota archaeon]
MDSETGAVRKTWWKRAGLKSLSGLLFAFALWGPITGVAIWEPIVSLELAALGVVVYSVYFKLERDWRKTNRTWLM